MLMLACLIGGCSQLDPFIDRRRNAGEKDMTKLYVGRSTPENPAVCYNILTTSYAEVKKLADEGCVRPSLPAACFCRLIFTLNAKNNF